jgi:antitoxin component of RelBE/YafQ-DinJ toxin-antitoxin module
LFQGCGKITGEPTFLGHHTVEARLDNTIKDATAKVVKKLGHPFEFKVEKILKVCASSRLNPVSIGV